MHRESLKVSRILKPSMNTGHLMHRKALYNATRRFPTGYLGHENRINMPMVKSRQRVDGWPGVGGGGGVVVVRWGKEG